MKHVIEFDATHVSDAAFGALLRRMAEEIARTEDHPVTVSGTNSDGEYAASALPVPLGGWIKRCNPSAAQLSRR